MTEENLFPAYIPRQEERQILDVVEQVRQDGRSRALLLYGQGGVGKTRLVRGLAQRYSADRAIAWLDPIDIDDTEYWLLSNLEENVARQLDPDNRYFGPYAKYLSQLPRYTRTQVSAETVVSHLGRIKQVFTECYKEFIAKSGKTVVLAFDTVETIRGMYLLPTLTQWMKLLPATLFILSGRPLPDHNEDQDPIQRELEDPYQRIPVTTVHLGEFTREAAAEYLERSSVAVGLATEERMKLVLLTRGHPLWLALAVSYLGTKGIPEEAEAPLQFIERNMPYGGKLTRDGEQLNDEFKRRLVAPYRETDFWPEAVKRLAAVRQGVNEPIWQRLLEDRPFPPGVSSWEETWDQLLEIPWIRPRANSRFVTLHDAMAEELAQRVIPLHDQDGAWRRDLWQRVVRIYREQTEGPESAFEADRAALEHRLPPVDEKSGMPGEVSDAQRAFVKEAVQLDARKRELDQLKTARLLYQLLSDFAAGCEEFLRLFETARRDGDVLFQDLLATAMQRFLPGSVDARVFDDMISGVIDKFRTWLTTEQPELHVEIGLHLAGYMISAEQPAAALRLLKGLPAAVARVGQLYRLNIQLGNAYLRIPGQVSEGLLCLERALALAEGSELPAADRHRLVAEAHKEMGFYYRNVGLWDKADQAYQQARDAILAAGSSEENRAEMSSIQTNWAYVKGLGGYYSDGTSLIESAITIRQRLKMRQEEGISWSVCGEVYRYQQRFQKAWSAYTKAEQIFDEQPNQPWLGMIYQEQAICLFQAVQDGIVLQPGVDSIEKAKDLALRAVEICRDHHVRGYPSALNRAGRIYGETDPDEGLRLMAEGIEQGRVLSDGWYWFANLVEYAELSFRAWVQTGRREYRDGINSREAAIDRVMAEYQYPDLRGRWDLVRGHLAIRDWLEKRDDRLLDVALNAYKQGFQLIAEGGYLGSSGTYVVPGEFATFREHLAELPASVQAAWREELRRAWSGSQAGSTLLLARLEELY